MWNMTPYGFTSAVAHRKKKGHLLIRSRDERSLKSFCKQAGVPERKIHSNFPSDYPFRVIVKREIAAQWAYDQMMGIDYDNFKSRAAKVPNELGYVGFLHKVWSAGHSLTSREVTAKNWRAWDSHDRRFKLGKYSPKKSGTRWSSGGAWGSGYYSSPSGLDTNPLRDAGEDDDRLTLDTIMEMTEHDREDAIAELEKQSKEGDVHAMSLLDEIDMMLPEDDGTLFKSVHSMTDEEFAVYEQITGGA